jgi:hypothetical protein
MCEPAHLQASTIWKELRMMRKQTGARNGIRGVSTWLLSLLVLTALTTACGTVRLVSPYDEVIDSGLAEYRLAINTFVRDMGDLSGTAEGTYEANQTRYNEFDSKIDLLVNRAAMNGGGKGCKLTGKLTERIVTVMGDQIPADLTPAAQTDEGNSLGCTHRLLVLIQTQLGTLEQIHKDTDKCRPPDGGAEVSCLRPATSKTAIAITNQSIDAAWVVEMAKKQGEED